MRAKSAATIGLATMLAVGAAIVLTMLFIYVVFVYGLNFGGSG